MVYEKVDHCARLRLCDFPPSTFSKELPRYSSLVRSWHS